MRYAILLAGIFVLAGCASSYMPGSPPTASSVQDGQVYKKTLYLPTDFDVKGQLRNISEYDFMAESAPCTALGAAYKEPPTNTAQYFLVQIAQDGGDLTMVMECRERGTLSLVQRRLFLVGSAHECTTQVWDAFWSIHPLYRGRAKLCTEYSKAPATYQELHARYIAHGIISGLR